MALTFQESNDLMMDLQFRGRIKVAALLIAQYYVSEDQNTPAHNSRFKWGQQTYLNPDGVATQLHPPVVMDVQVQTDGAAISDDNLKKAVEGVVSKLI